MTSRKILLLLAAVTAFTGAAASVAAAERSRTKSVEIIDARLRVVTTTESGCRGMIFLHAEFTATGDGLVRFRFLEHGRKEAREYTAHAKRRVDGSYRAGFERAFRVNGPVNRKFMVEAVGQDVATGWQPVTVSCGV